MGEGICWRKIPGELESTPREKRRCLQSVQNNCEFPSEVERNIRVIPILELCGKVRRIMELPGNPGASWPKSFRLPSQILIENKENAPGEPWTNSLTFLNEILIRSQWKILLELSVQIPVYDFINILIKSQWQMFLEAPGEIPSCSFMWSLLQVNGKWMLQKILIKREWEVLLEFPGPFPSCFLVKSLFPGALCSKKTRKGPPPCL